MTAPRSASLSTRSNIGDSVGARAAGDRTSRGRPGVGASGDVDRRYAVLDEPLDRFGAAGARSADDQDLLGNGDVGEACRVVRAAGSAARRAHGRRRIRRAGGRRAGPHRPRCDARPRRPGSRESSVQGTGAGRGCRRRRSRQAAGRATRRTSRSSIAVVSDRFPASNECRSDATADRRQTPCSTCSRPADTGHGRVGRVGPGDGDHRPDRRRIGCDEIHRQDRREVVRRGVERLDHGTERALAGMAVGLRRQSQRPEPIVVTPDAPQRWWRRRRRARRPRDGPAADRRAGRSTCPCPSVVTIPR